MIQIRKANETHVDGIVKVCTEANWATYSDIYTRDYIEAIIEEYYNHDRVLKEVTTTSVGWGGYFVASDKNKVIGAAGGGMIDDTASEVYVLYIDPTRRNEGIGTLLLDAVTEQQKKLQSCEQWVSVQKGNNKGIPFYEARGFQYQYEEESDGYISLRYRRKIGKGEER
jgi:GNAT superfamily N-acetyltransferase